MSPFWPCWLKEDSPAEMPAFLLPWVWRGVSSTVVPAVGRASLLPSASEQPGLLSLPPLHLSDTALTDGAHQNSGRGPDSTVRGRVRTSASWQGMAPLMLFAVYSSRLNLCH